MKILIIQTAFLGDVVLATPLIEKLKDQISGSEIDFLLSKGNEALLKNNPGIRKILTFDKKKAKYRNLIKLVSVIRKNRYDCAINVQRFLATGILTAFSGAKCRIGFDKNPLSFMFDHKIRHKIANDDSKIIHEVERNLALLEPICDTGFTMPKIYPSKEDQSIVPESEYICIAPASIWHTKQLPAEKWIQLIDKIPINCNVFLIGSQQDKELCEHIILGSRRKGVGNMAGKLSLLQSAALIAKAKITYTNDSAPMHLASAVNAPVAAVFCSTVAQFGFGPLSDKSIILETKEKLDCRPCGIHGFKRCPKGHFQCSDIDVSDMANALQNQ
jgi:heptosyltransferase-2